MIFSHILSSSTYHNTGDIASCPLDYFPEFTGCQRVCYTQAGLDDSTEPIVFGGGGLFMHNWHEHLLRIASRRPVIIWGAGMNYPLWEIPAGLQEALAACTLVGLRDKALARRLGYEWVPDASCMHPLLAELVDVETDGVLQYAHLWGPLDVEGIPRLTNMDRATSVETVLRAMAAADTIVTDSYHGAYWSMLLQRSVILWKPDTMRFFSGLPYLPPSVHNPAQLNWLLKYGSFQEPDPYLLGRCRQINTNFARKVLAIMLNETKTT